MPTAEAPTKPKTKPLTEKQKTLNRLKREERKFFRRARRELVVLAGIVLFGLLVQPSGLISAATQIAMLAMLWRIGKPTVEGIKTRNKYFKEKRAPRKPRDKPKVTATTT